MVVPAGNQHFDVRDDALSRFDHAIKTRMRTTDVDIDKLEPPTSRPFADPAKLERLGPFDWAKYIPIDVEKDGARLIIQSGMTRVAAARQAGITKLPAYVYPKSGP